MEGNPRFISSQTLGQVYYIRDTKDDTIVAHVTGYGRDKNKTLAMVKVMLDALNKAVEPRRGMSAPPSARMDG